MKRLVLLASPGPAPAWDGGDSVIRAGFENLFAEQLKGYELTWVAQRGADAQDWSPMTLAEIESAPKYDALVEGAQAVLKIGTPNWWNRRDRQVYRAAVQQGCTVSLVGIGLGHRWHVGDGGPIAMQESAYHSFAAVVCRDPQTFVWWAGEGVKNCLRLLPCPGFFAFPTRIPAGKTKVLLGIAPSSHLHTLGAFFLGSYEAYLRAMAHLRVELQARGCAVTLWSERPTDTHYEELLDVCGLGGARFAPQTHAEFATGLENHDVVFSARVHGVLAAAGAGIPSYGFGIDLRQFAWDVPGWIGRQDIRNQQVDVRRALEWWEKLNCGITSQFLRMTRLEAKEAYRDLWPTLVGE